jgi:hypothetical protein
VRQRVAARLVDACNQISSTIQNFRCVQQCSSGGGATRALVPFSPIIMRGFLYLSLTCITAL